VLAANLPDEQTEERSTTTYCEKACTGKEMMYFRGKEVSLQPIRLDRYRYKSTEITKAIEAHLAPEMIHDRRGGMKISKFTHPPYRRVVLSP